MPGSMREVRQDLSRRFGGITTFTRAPAHGTSEARGEIVHDDIVVFEVMTDTLDRPWWEAYRHRPRRQPAAGAKICLMRCVSMTMDAPTVVQLLKEFAARSWRAASRGVPLFCGAIPL
jgi:hypothetical protein